MALVALQTGSVKSLTGTKFIHRADVFTEKRGVVQNAAIAQRDAFVHEKALASGDDVSGLISGHGYPDSLLPRYVKQDSSQP
jgi:hypothetical protein